MASKNKILLYLCMFVVAGLTSEWCTGVLQLLNKIRHPEFVMIYLLFFVCGLTYSCQPVLICISMKCTLIQEGKLWRGLNSVWWRRKLSSTHL